MRPPRWLLSRAFSLFLGFPGVNEVLLTRGPTGFSLLPQLLLSTGVGHFILLVVTVLLLLLPPPAVK